MASLNHNQAVPQRHILSPRLLSEPPRASLLCGATVGFSNTWSSVVAASKIDANLDFVCQWFSCCHKASPGERGPPFRSETSLLMDVGVLFFIFFPPAKPTVCSKLSLLMDVCARFLMSVKFQPALRFQLCQWDLTRLQQTEKTLVCCRLSKGLPACSHRLIQAQNFHCDLCKVSIEHLFPVYSRKQGESKPLHKMSEQFKSF